MRFAVNRVWKGVVRHQFFMFVLSGEDQWSADFFKEGTSYLVFAHAFSAVDASDATPSIAAGTPVVWVSMCTGTRSVEDGRASIKQLGPGTAPTR